MIDTSLPCDETWLRLIAGLVTGLILGSFVTMLSYRLPRGLSIVMPGSHCPACKTRLQPRDLVPVLSWVLQRGRCRHCGSFTGWRYLLIEIAVAGASGAAFLMFGFTYVLPIALALIVTLVTALVIRLERPSAGFFPADR
jgi:leader peptidase (prepilin peptidase) / N-methyltransferase